jgi:membrane peptidoglycan carboxypeptidase
MINCREGCTVNGKRTAIGIIVAGAIALIGTVSLAEKDPAPQAPVPLSEEAPASPVTREQIRERINSALDKLVSDKVITQEQKDAVLEAMDKRRQCVEKERDGKPGRKHLKCRRKSVLKGLTKEGVITREQADAIRKAIKSVYDSMKKPGQAR